MRFHDLLSWGRSQSGTWDALRCPKCGAVFHVGDDAQVATWESVLESMGRSGMVYGDTLPNRDDLMSKKSDIDSAEAFQKVREAVAAGRRRRWRCGECNYAGIKYPAKQTPAAPDEVDEVVMKQVAYQFARLQQPPAQVSGSTLSFAEKLAHANLAKISGAVRDSFQGRSTPGHSFYDHHHSIVLVVTCFPWSEREVQKRLLDPEYPPMGYISLWTRILNAQPSGIDYQLIHCIWCSTSDEGVRLHVGTSGVGKNLGKLPTVLPRQLLNDEERKHAGL